MRILITGIAGFIGFHLAKKLPYDEIVGIDNLNDYYDINIKIKRLQQLGFKENSFEFNKKYTSGNIDFYRINLHENFYGLGEFDYVVHLAAQAGVRHSISNPQSYIDSNIQGFLNVLELVRYSKVNHFVYASSSSVYGLNNIPLSTKDKTDQPVSLYGATKKANELMAHSYSHLYNIPTTGLRFFTVYGEWGRPDMALHLFTKNIIEGNPIDVYNNGQMKRDFTYIDDIIESIVRIIDVVPEKPQVYNVGNNNPVNLMDFVRIIEKEVGKEAMINYLPLQDGDIVSSYANVDPLYETIGFKPNTPIEEGIKNYVKWYKRDVL